MVFIVVFLARKQLVRIIDIIEIQVRGGVAGCLKWAVYCRSSPSTV